MSAPQTANCSRHSDVRVLSSSRFNESEHPGRTSEVAEFEVKFDNETIASR